MRRKSLHKKYNIFYSRKAVLVPVLFLLIIMFLFTFSCNLTKDSTQKSDVDKSDDQSAEGSQDIDQEQAAYINESSDTVEEASETEDEEETEYKEETEDEEETETSELTINVYYSDAMGEYLVGEARVVSSENKYVDALNELMKLPVDGSLYRLVPDSTKVNSVVVEEGLAKVDFSKEFIENKITSDTEDNLLIYSIVNTLTEFSEVNSVSFYIDGEKLETLGMTDVSEPFFRRSDLIKQ